MGNEHVIRTGSVEELRTQLKLIEPRSIQEAKEALDHLNSIWLDEINTRGRIGALRLIDARTNKIYRELERMCDGKGKS